MKKVKVGEEINSNSSNKAIAAAAIDPTSNWAERLQKDDIFPDSKLVNLTDFFINPETIVDSSHAKAIVVNSEIVHVVSDAYGHLPNENFFLEAERKLIDADINYATRTINRKNRSFIADYILNDSSYHVSLKGAGGDKIAPMMRFHNSYNGRAAWASFGFFRGICLNGLMATKMKIGFKVQHREGIVDVVMPKIDELIVKFLDNEYYTLMKKFEVLAERPLESIEGFVAVTAQELGLFNYAISEKNPEPSKAARFVMETINREADTLGARPSLWLGYNAFNEYIHKSGQHFLGQKQKDAELFEKILEMAN